MGHAANPPRRRDYTTVRRAAPCDVATMLALMRLDARASAGAFSPEAAGRGLHILTADQRALVLVAERGGAVVGFAAMQEHFETATATRCGIIGDLVVPREAAPLRIEEELIEAMVRHARKRDLGEVRLVVDHGRATDIVAKTGRRWSPSGRIMLRYDRDATEVSALAH